MNDFLKRTAEDYDISYLVAKSYYEKYRKLGTFYQKLEEYIKNRAIQWFLLILNYIIMPNEIKCSRCNGAGYYDALVSAHDDETENVKCTKCNGKGFIYQMTDEEESDYYADYW